MRRRSTVSKPVKNRGHHASGQKPGKAQTRRASTTDLQQQLDRRTRELNEALAQQAASAEVLQVISSSPGELEPVFNAMLENATRICEATFGNLFLCEGPIFRVVAVHGKQSHVDFTRRNPVADLRDNPGIPLERLANTKQIIHLPDLRTDQSCIGKNARIINLVEVAGARTLLNVPMLKEDALIGAISMYRQEVRPFTDKQIELVKNFASQAVIAIENTRLLSELRESLQQQTATADVLKAISRSAFDLEAALDTLLGTACRLCGADIGTIRYEEGTGYRLAATFGCRPEWREHFASYSTKPDRGSVFGRTIIEGRTVHIPDLLADREFGRPAQQKLMGIRAALGVPLARDREVFGVINLFRSTPRSFTQRQIELVETFANQAVIAIENARLFEAEQQRTTELSEALEQQTATSEVLRVISGSPGDLEPVFQAMLENATRICEARFANMYLREGDTFRLAASHNTPPALVEEHTRTSYRAEENTPPARMLRTRSVVHIADLTSDEAYLSRNPRVIAAAELGGVRTVVVVPLIKESEVIGSFNIFRQEVRPFTEKQIDLLKNFAAQAVIAIENTRLLNELRERTEDLSEALEQQTATSEVLKVISSSRGELAPVFDTMLANATQICEAKFGTLYLREADSFRAVATTLDAPSAYVEARKSKTRLQPSRGGPLWLAATTKMVAHIADLKELPSYRERHSFVVNAVELGGFRTVLAVPMLQDNELVGAITIMRQEVRPFTDKQIELLKNFAAQAVIAIENARLLNELRESLLQQTATADVLKLISRSAYDLRTVLQALIESAARFCDADKASVLREKDGAFYRTETFGYSREFTDYVKDVPIRPERGSASGRSLLEGRVIHISDVAADPEYTQVEAQRLGDFRTILCVPMLRDGIPIGVLILTRTKVRPFTDKQIELVTTFADQAAIAIENVRLFENVEARTRELAQSLEDLRTAQDRLVQTEKLASLGQLTAGIAHEIKNPLNFVNNFSGVSVELIDELHETLRHIKADDKILAEINELTNTLRGNLDKVVQHGKRADSIVKNMLQHSRQGSAEHRPVDINTLVEESLNLAWHGARAEQQGFNITLERSLDPAAGEADVFPQDITRVLLNLISNGFYATTRREAQADGSDYEPTLAASTKDVGDRVEIRIRDNGTGIPPEVKEQMFNPFFTTKPAGEGTGLGLSISHDIIVKQHGGSIEVDTRPGEFTEIKIILPRSGTFPTEPAAHA